MPYRARKVLFIYIYLFLRDKRYSENKNVEIYMTKEYHF